MTAPAEVTETFSNVARGTNGKVAPLWNEDAERAVLAAMLLEPRAVDTARALLTADAFARGAHRVLFATMVELRRTAVAIDPVTLRNTLEASGQLKAAGGAEAIGQLYDEVPTADHIADHAAIVQAFARRRQLLGLGQAMIAQAQDLAVPVDDAFAAAGAGLMAATVRGEHAGFRPIKADVFEAMERIEQRRAGTVRTGLTTGWPELDDRMAGGPERGTLVVVVGVPSSGKTSLVWNLLTNLAIDGVGSVGMVSAEMTRQMLIESQLASLSGVPRERIKTGDLSAEQMHALARAGVHALSGRAIVIDDAEMPDIEDVVARCVLLKSQYPDLCAVGVDFIQLLQRRTKERGELHEATLRHIAYALKGMAKQLGVVVYALAQPNDKQIEDRDDKRPQLRDIQGSSGIRQAADVIMLLYRPQQYSASAGNELEVNLGKNKFGPIGRAVLEWDGPCVRVTSARRRQLEAELRASRTAPLSLEVHSHG